MNLENKLKNISNSYLVAILGLITIILVYLQVPNVLWAKECPQKRSTVIAPNKYFNKVNPLRNEAPHLKKGKVLANIKAKPLACKQCHGIDGNGQGAMSSNMNPKPRNFTCKQTMDQISDGQLFWIIKYGSEGTSMPPYKHLSDKQIWQLVKYIRSLSDLPK